MSEEKLVCKYNQKGFCKYRLQCSKEHVNEICQDHFQCKDFSCKLRHPKRCQAFDVDGKCRFTDCAYLHVKDGVNFKVDALERDVKELKDKIQSLVQNKHNTNDHRIEMLEKEMIVLNYDVTQLNANIRKTEILLDELNKSTSIQTNAKETEAEVWFHCKVCDYKSKRKTTLNKHNNTKHPEGSYKCFKCAKTFISKDILESHKNKRHMQDKGRKGGSQSKNNASVVDVKECSLCDDQFLTQEEFKIHITEHLEEIQNIDVEYLKSGNEIFSCSLCSFESNVSKDIKDHLADHTLTTKVGSENLSISKRNKEAILKSKNWRDMYDDEGNPLFETTDEENSSEDDESSSEDDDK